MKQECMVHMLPTDKASPIWLTQHEAIMVTVDGRDIAAVSNQHLYFTTDEEIKEGDWCLLDTGTFLAPSGKYAIAKFNSKIPRKAGISEDIIYSRHKKIIATTNPELWLMAAKSGSQGPIYNIGKIPESFIKEYVDKQGKIEKVWLEYEQYNVTVDECDYIHGGYSYKKRPKLNSDGSVIILPNEEKMYTRADIVEILVEYGDEFRTQINLKVLDTSSRLNFPSPRKWFDKNYPK